MTQIPPPTQRIADTSLKATSPWYNFWAGLASSTSRTVLTADRNYYVRTDGNDSNSGLTNTASGAFKTPQRAANAVQNEIIQGNYTAIVNFGNGVSGDYSLNYATGSVRHIGNNADPTQVQLNVFLFRCHTSFQGVSFVSGGAAVCPLNIGDYSELVFLGTNHFPTTTDFTHIFVYDCAQAHVISDYTITGGSGGNHIVADRRGLYDQTDQTITLSGTPDFPAGYVAVSQLGSANFESGAFSGSATGPRYSVVHPGSIILPASGTLPGNAVGSISGLYTISPQSPIGFFSVHMNGSDMTGLTGGSTYTLQFSTGTDPYDFFDASSTYRYTPTVPGYYKFHLQGACPAGTAGETGQAKIRLNGSTSIAQGPYFNATAATGNIRSEVSAVVALNGSTDYVEFRFTVPTGSTIIRGAADSTFVYGYRVGDL